MMRSFLIAVTRNPLSLVGTLLTTFSVAIVGTLFLLELVGFHGGPYLGILAYLVFPLIAAAGLVLIPVGMRRDRKRRARQPGRGFPVIDLNNLRTRRIVILIFVLSIVNVMVFATTTYKGVHVMESNEFCGTACHSVMQPEYTAYQGSPHARVACVDCHIGSGADWWAKSKLGGAWQVVSVTFDLYPRPIETPVHDLRPARDTCEQCHWPTKFVGDNLVVIDRFESDEENTALKTVLNLHVGGQIGNGSHGIHWHVDPGVEIRYRSDRSRETIYDVELRLPDGTVKTYLSPEQGEQGWDEEAGELEWRLMDCVDCHNRPTHIYRLPEEEVDGALAAGSIDRELPFLRREALAALEAEYASHDEARAGIPARLEAFYRESYPELATERAAEIATAGREVAAMYTRNVFPSMKVGWGTYPDHIGHETSPGCYRCHNDEHESMDGDVISQDCDTCHAVLAWDEEDPEILAALDG
ncbi:MAG: NapC/NirT family cytochrome c [Thermoanaerobaculia bacterium]|nr:NapC/NirT family cytochrome c [Thermoanaerobaculia bacterium]